MMLLEYTMLAIFSAVMLRPTMSALHRRQT